MHMQSYAGSYTTFEPSGVVIVWSRVSGIVVSGLASTLIRMNMHTLDVSLTDGCGYAGRVLQGMDANVAAKQSARVYTPST